MYLQQVLLLKYHAFSIKFWKYLFLWRIFIEIVNFLYIFFLNKFFDLKCIKLWITCSYLLSTLQLEIKNFSKHHIKLSPGNSEEISRTWQPIEVYFSSFFWTNECSKLALKPPEEKQTESYFSSFFEPTSVLILHWKHLTRNKQSQHWH